MIYKIKKIVPLDNYKLLIDFDNGENVTYDMEEDINSLPHYDDLKRINGLFKQVKIDESRTIAYWNDYIDLPSDILYEYGKK